MCPPPVNQTRLFCTFRPTGISGLGPAGRCVSTGNTGQGFDVQHVQPLSACPSFPLQAPAFAHSDLFSGQFILFVRPLMDTYALFVMLQYVGTFHICASQNMMPFVQCTLQVDIYRVKPDLRRRKVKKSFVTDTVADLRVRKVWTGLYFTPPPSQPPPYVPSFSFPFSPSSCWFPSVLLGLCCEICSEGSVLQGLDPSGLQGPNHGEVSEHKY